MARHGLGSQLHRGVRGRVVVEAEEPVAGLQVVRGLPHQVRLARPRLPPARGRGLGAEADEDVADVVDGEAGDSVLPSIQSCTTDILVTSVLQFLCTKASVPIDDPLGMLKASCM